MNTLCSPVVSFRLSRAELKFIRLGLKRIANVDAAPDAYCASSAPPYPTAKSAHDTHNHISTMNSAVGAGLHGKLAAKAGHVHRLHVDAFELAVIGRSSSRNSAGVRTVRGGVTSLMRPPSAGRSSWGESPER